MHIIETNQIAFLGSSEPTTAYDGSHSIVDRFPDLETGNAGMPGHSVVTPRTLTGPANRTQINMLHVLRMRPYISG